MKRPALTILVFLLVVAGLALAGIKGVGWLTRGPLSGETSHDFGIVPIEDGDGVVRHTFALTNDTDDAVVIQRIQPSCGCTTLKPSTMAVAPGDSVELPVKLVLSASGLKKTNVKLILAHGESEKVQTLFIEAIGQQVNPLTTLREEVILRPDWHGRLTIFFEQQGNDDRPAAPSLAVPAEVDAAFNGWEFVQASNNRLHKPSRWRGQIEMSLKDGAELSEGATLAVSMPSHDPLSLNLVPRKTEETEEPNTFDPGVEGAR